MSFLRRKSLVRLTMLAIAVAGLGTFHRPLLRAVACVVVVDQMPADVDYLCIACVDDSLLFDSPGAAEDVVAVCRQSPARRILLLAPPLSRSIQVGAGRSLPSVVEQDFFRRGVPRETLLTIPCPSADPWQMAAALAAWIKDHPDSRVRMFCNRFESAAQRHSLDGLLNAADAQRLTITAWKAPTYDESNWWRCREGIRTLMFGYLSLIFSRSEASELCVTQFSSPDEYERHFLQTLASRPPQ